MNLKSKKKDELIEIIHLGLKEIKSLTDSKNASDAKNDFYEGQLADIFEALSKPDSMGEIVIPASTVEQISQIKFELKNLLKVKDDYDECVITNHNNNSLIRERGVEIMQLRQMLKFYLDKKL